MASGPDCSARCTLPVCAQDPSVWACLASMAMASKELNTAEVAFAAIDEVRPFFYHSAPLRLHGVSALRSVDSVS